jgi:hypothetical protein
MEPYILDHKNGDILLRKGKGGGHFPNCTEQLQSDLEKKTENDWLWLGLHAAHVAQPAWTLTLQKAEVL